MSTLKEMEDQWALQMAATDPKTGKRIVETDPKYARAVFALGVKIEEMRKAEASQPQLSDFQIQQLQWLERAQGARDKSGAVVSQEMSAAATAYRKSLHQAQTAVFEGRDISSTIATTERDMAEKGWTLGTPAKPSSPGQVLIPSNLQTGSYSEGNRGQLTHTDRSPG